MGFNESKSEIAPPKKAFVLMSTKAQKHKSRDIECTYLMTLCLAVQTTTQLFNLSTRQQ